MKHGPVLCTHFCTSMKLKKEINVKFESEIICIYSGVFQFSHSVVSDSLQPNGLQHTRPPCPSPTPRTYSNSCPSHQWCHATISSSVILLSSCLQSFPASGTFPISQFFPSAGQTIEVSTSASVPPMNIQDWYPLGWTGCISLQSKGLSRVSSNTTVQKHPVLSFLYSPTLESLGNSNKIFSLMDLRLFSIYPNNFEKNTWQNERNIWKIISNHSSGNTYGISKL